MAIRGSSGRSGIPPLRTPTNASDSIRIDLDSASMSKNALRTRYELVTDLLKWECVAKILNCSKPWPEFPIDPRTARSDYGL